MQERVTPGGLKLPTRQGVGVAQEPPIKQAIERMERNPLPTIGAEQEMMHDGPKDLAAVAAKVSKQRRLPMPLRLRMWLRRMVGLDTLIEALGQQLTEQRRLLDGQRRDMEAIGRAQARAMFEANQQIDTLETKLGLSRLMTKGDRPDWTYLLETPAERRTRNAKELRDSQRQQAQSRNRKSRAGSRGGSTATATASRSRT